ncbi:methyltransferase type 11 [Candidatus Nitrosopumilus koreensis AR1]|uniref:Methyltransferase type 11 n=1 Tax=Candidatus Nitrosopumilus koreensis AR1 TaxID=1229908 RepID=K0B6B8_9ARCH|nr:MULTISPECIES: methyltransferase domain-containing protein [Nitrosopumilus]AFS81014.1 methyltransferase type 11 [Candidatus Nitrosopumilus koreensis AR1]
MDVFLWTFRRNEKDTVNLYNVLSPVMQLATGGSMLNFGYWSSNNCDPLSAQENLCMVFADLAELSSAKHVVDVGSGLSAPSHLWQQKFPNIFLYDVNINYSQLYSGKKQKIEFLNSTSTKLPFVNNSVDRVLALESAQHFKPLSDFIVESKRILLDSGLLVMAIPVTLGNSSLKDLGMLKFTWSSEHYSLDAVREILDSCEFVIKNEQLIGKFVYEPLADYYLKNREHLKKSILKEYPNYVENILYKSIVKMKSASEKRIIDYVILKCTPKTTR